MRVSGDSRRHHHLLLTVALAIALPAGALAQDHDASDSKQTPAPIYDESADAKADVAAAVAKAKRDNQRVLVMLGANWCGWCHKLHGLFKSDRDIAHTLLYEYQLVMVDIGRWDKNTDLAKGYGVDPKSSGVPLLVILDADGKPLAVQNTAELEEGNHHDPEKVKALLEKHAAKPVDAADALKAALARAAAKEKLVFLHFGAPWCPWCHKLEDFLAQPEIAAILDKDFVDLKIDVDRMTGGKDVQKRFNPTGGGIPWFAFLNAQGEAVATSDAPTGGNVGFPVEPAEIGHFVGMLNGAAKRISGDEVAKIKAALEQSARKIKGLR